MDIKDKLLDRVRKLNAMAQDTSSPNEAAIAARRARALMDKHGITASDLTTSPFASLNASDRSYRAMPIWYVSLSVGVARANDCDTVLVFDTNRRKAVEFRGYESDVIGAQLMLDYLITAMERQWLLYKSSNVSYEARSAGSSFRKGFTADMQRRLYAIADDRKTASVDASTGTALVAQKMAMVRAEFGVVEYKNITSRVSDGGANAAGRAASQATNINRQVAGQQQRALA